MKAIYVEGGLSTDLNESAVIGDDCVVTVQFDAAAVEPVIRLAVRLGNAQTFNVELDENDADGLDDLIREAIRDWAEAQKGGDDA